MATRKLDKAEWRAYCDRISKALVGKQAEVEVASLRLGSQIAAEWLPLLGVAYDPKDDIAEIALDGLDHLIHKPRELYIDESPTGVAGLEIVDAEGIRQIVRLRDPLMLPAPSTTG
jgi:uncharacterized protein DUF5335